MALRCVISFRTPTPRSASITSTTTAGTPYVSGVRGGLTAAATISGNLQPAEVAALEPPAFRPRLPAILHARSSTCPHSTGCRRRPTSLASRRSSAGLRRRRRCRRRTQRMPRAPRRPAAPATRSSIYPKHIKLWGIGASAGFAGWRVASGRVLVPRQPAGAVARCGGAPRRGRRRQPADRHRSDAASQVPVRHRDHRLPQGRNAPGVWRPRPRRSARS